MHHINSTLRVTATGTLGARVFVRQQEFSVGPPMKFDIAAPRISACEYAYGAVGAEIVEGVRAFANRRRIELHAIEAVVNGELQNPLAFLESSVRRDVPASAAFT